MADVLRTLAPYLAYAYVSFVGWTSRVLWGGLEHLRRAEGGGRGFIYVFWHQRQALFTYTHRDKGIRVMVSRSKDGEIVAKAMALSRIGAVRGSSSRGAASAARELLEALDQRAAVALTPDGPRGPAREVKPGVLYLAQKSGRPILPIASASSRGFFLRKPWDRFYFPLPFSRIAVCHGRPIRVLPGDDLPARAAELKAELDRVTSEADRMAA